MKRYIFLSIFVRNGEYEYSQKSVHISYDELTTLEYGEYWAKTYYGGEVDIQNDEYYFNGGEVMTKCETVKEITKEEYDILNKFL